MRKLIMHWKQEHNKNEIKIKIKLGKFDEIKHLIAINAALIMVINTLEKTIEYGDWE